MKISYLSAMALLLVLPCGRAANAQNAGTVGKNDLVLKPGENIIALRTNNPHHMGGLFRRPFLYRPQG